MVGGQASTLQQHQVLWLTLRKRNLETRFRWFPEVPPQNMPAFFQTVARSGGCFVSTSKGESFGLAALEAMASGCPVVAPSTGGLEEIIADGENGLLYPPGKLKEAASLIQGLLTDRKTQQKMGENARSFARRYSSAASVETFMRVLDKLEEQDHR
jgi:glycosyltransferase involved in cell wall biosynthesis